jgi:hypothetical protein
MPIVARTPARCFQLFEDHVRKLIAATVSDRYQVARMFVTGKTRMTLAFREHGPVAVPIKTAYGRLYFYLGQALEAVSEDGKYRLTTQQYWYRVQEKPDLTEKARIRWEYEADTARNAHCRHHAQIPVTLELGSGLLSLEDVHLPTGWVTMEEVIRFLIVELEMKPPCGTRWPKVLEESETAFYEEFTSKRYKRSTGPAT